MRHFRREWIEALESGRFPQEFGSYKNGDARCAMGVALEVLLEQSALPQFAGSSPTHMRQYGVVCDLLGITSHQGQLVEKMNDSDHLTHSEIARMLRQLDDREVMVEAEHDPAVWENTERLRRSEETSPRD